MTEPSAGHREGYGWGRLLTTFLLVCPTKSQSQVSPKPFHYLTRFVTMLTLPEKEVKLDISSAGF